MQHAPRATTARMVLIALAASLAMLIAACGDQAPEDEIIEVDPPEEADEPQDPGDDPEDEPTEDPADEPEDEPTEDPADDPDDGDDTDEGADAAEGDLRAEVDLQVPAQDDTEDTQPVTYTLVCGASPGIEAADDAAGWIDGENPIDPAEACAAAEELLNDPPVQETDQMCTQIYGGPHTATVTVTDGDDEHTQDFSRTNGCEINDWDEFAALIGTV